MLIAAEANDGDGLEIKLGGMAQQTTLHCVQCHEFTAEVPLLATRDSAAGTLRPGQGQCLACHEMRRMLEEFDVVAEPAPDDLLIERDGARVVVDPVSLGFVKGSEIDFVEDLIGSSFKIKNPNVTAACGCGTSFSI